MSFDFRTNASPTINLNLDDEEAVPKCENGPGCTHFTWTLFNGGTCWMKKGRMCRNGTETITIKADDPNSFCAKLAKFAKISGTDLNWYDFPENDDEEYPALKDHLSSPTKCPLTPPPPPPPPLPTSSMPTTNTTAATSINGSTTRCKSGMQISSCTSSTNSLNPQQTQTQCLKNYTWRLINEAATLKRKLVLGAQQQKISRQGGLCHSIGGSSCASISSVLIELENKRTVSSIEATQVKIERETSSLPLPLPLPLPPLSPEPDIDVKVNERVATLEKNNKLFKDGNQEEPETTTTTSSANQRTLPTSLKKPATSATATAAANIIKANCANKNSCTSNNGNTIWLGIQTSNTPPDSMEQSSNNSCNQKPTTMRKQPPKIEIIDGNNRRWFATVDAASGSKTPPSPPSNNKGDQSSCCCCGNCGNSNKKTIIRAAPSSNNNKQETMIVPVAVPVQVAAKEICNSVWVPNRCNSNSSSNFASSIGNNCLNNSITSNCEVNFPRHDCSGVFCCSKQQEHMITPPPPPPPPVITPPNKTCFCGACDPPLPPPPAPQSLPIPIIPQATQSAIAAASAPLIVANPHAFPHLHFHMQQLQDEFIEPSSPLVDNYNILAPTRKNTENALVSLSQMQQLQRQQQQQQQSTCQCGACQNLNISDCNDLVPTQVFALPSALNNFGSANSNAAMNTTVAINNGDDDVVCFCENCTGGGCMNNDVSVNNQAFNFIDPNSSPASNGAALLQLLASLGINPAMLLQQHQQQQQLDQSQFMEPQLNFDMIPVNAQQSLGNEFELGNNNAGCNFCCDSPSGFEYIIC